MKLVIIIALAFVLLIPVTVFATEWYVSDPDENIKITYSTIIKTKFLGNFVIGTVKNVGDEQLDKIIIKIAEHTSRLLEHSEIPFINSLRPHESSYFIIPIDSLTNCYELSILPYTKDASSNTYNGQEDTQIFDSLEITQAGTSSDTVSGQIKNNDEKSKFIEILVVAFKENEIVDYGLIRLSDLINENKTGEFYYSPINNPSQETNSDNAFTFDFIVRSIVVDTSSTVAGTKFDNFYPFQEIHRSKHYSEISFDNEDYTLGTCENGELVSTESETNNQQIPEWVKNNARWWGNDEIDDSTFVSGIQFLIKEDILKVSSNSNAESSSDEIPSWVKNNAKWWSEDAISETDFISGIEYLVNNGIIRVD